MTVEWHGDQFAEDLKKTLAVNLEKAAIYLAGRIKENINRSEARERVVGAAGVYYKGLDPSAEGEFPKKLTGFLQRSIAHHLSADMTQAVVGTNLDYGLYLETGTSKMGARPYLRQTLQQEQDTLAKIIATGKA